MRETDRELRRMLAGDGDKALLLIAIATGQQIANLPPILECAGPRDAVVWLESQEARRGGWTTGPTAVLRRRGIRVLDPVPIPDEPQGACAALAQTLGNFPSADWHPVFIGNGGTKPVSGGLGETLRSAASQGSNEPYTTVYGNTPAAELWVLPEGPAGRLLRRRYSQPGPTLEDIVHCSGHVLMDERKNPLVKLWPDAGDVSTNDYGTGDETTRGWHREHHEWERWKKVAEAGLADYQAAVRFLPARMIQWGLRRAIGSPEEVFNSAKNVAHDAGQKVAEWAADVSQREKLGALFETAVARRVQEWLNAKADPYPITEAWWRAHIARANAPSAKRAELDIVFVLANGVLLTLECKTFIEGLEELNARLLNLQVYASRLAKLVICWPCYSEFAEDDWFKTIHRKIEETVRPIFPTIGFTLEAQRAKYDVERVTYSCPRFEDALNSQFTGYMPQEKVMSSRDAGRNRERISHPHRAEWQL